MHENEMTPEAHDPNDQPAEGWEPPTFEVISGAEILAGGQLNDDAIALGNS